MASTVPKAVLVGLDSMQGIQAARILAAHDVPVIGIASDASHHATRTKVCEQIVIAESREETMEALARIGSELPAKAVLVPCQDGKVQMISRCRERLRQWYHIGLPKPDVLDMLTDKIAFYKYAQENGLPIPHTFFLYSREDAEQASRELEYPCVMKPPYRSPEWEAHTSLKAFKAHDAGELLALYDEYHEFADALIVQQYIGGRESDLYSCNCYFNAQNEPLVTFVARKLRQWPPETGQSSLGEECRDETVLEETLRLFRSVGYWGLGYMEMKRDPDSGSYYIVEPNIGRPTGRSAIAEAGGVALLYTMYCDLAGLPLPENRVQRYTGVKWIHVRRDTQAALHGWWHGHLGLREWLTSVRGRKAYAVFSWHDPRPFVADVLDTVRLLLSSRERQKRGL